MVRHGFHVAIATSLLVLGLLIVALAVREDGRVTSEERVAHIQELSASGRLSAARSAARLLARDRGDDWTVHALAGTLALSAQDLPAAHRAFKTASTLVAHAEIDVGLGRVAQRRGQLKESEAHYRKALAKAPLDPTALAFLAQVKARRGDHQEAKALLDRVRLVAPDALAVHEAAAQVLHFRGEWRQRDRAMARAKTLGSKDLSRLEALFARHPAPPPATFVPPF